MSIKLNNRVKKYKDKILGEISKGYKPHEVGRILEIDSRTIKRALEIWELEDAVALRDSIRAIIDPTKVPHCFNP